MLLSIETLTGREKVLSFDLDITREFGQKLTSNDIIVSILRKGKQAIVLGKEAKPTISQLVSKSDDLQIKSVREASKIVEDLTSKSKEEQK